MFKLFEKFPELQIGFLDKTNQNKQLPAEQTIKAGQTHSNHSARVGKADTGKVIEDVDALVTNQAGIILEIVTADCFPVYFFDPKTKTIALAHCGWRGIISGLVLKTLGEMGLITVM